ncbi:MAG: lactonase family protein [Tannerellaceae bacterium]|jgi:6-phosphogluconolactonase (cycloisomerase 2 family)|nr:lactonase family protein [Tannerellaceae bacterium]
MESLLFLLIGAYTAGLSDGVYLYEFDQAGGDARYVDMVTVENPSFIDVGDGAHLFAVTENTDEPSFANALSFDMGEKKLAVVNRQETFASAPCYIAVGGGGAFAVTANYGGGSLSVFPIEGDSLLPSTQLIVFEGSGPDSTRQEAAHLHCAHFSPDGKYLFATDLGSDRIYRFEVLKEADKQGHFLNEETMKTFVLAAGSGPRHITFHPSDKYMYIVNELSGTVEGFRYNGGDLEPFQAIVADTVGGRASADIHISPDGRFLYASVRNVNDGIAVFSINEADGRLTKVGYQPTGRHPRNFAITPNGKYLLAAEMNSSVIEVFEIDRATGLLTNIGKDIKDIDTPVLLKFL